MKIQKFESGLIFETTGRELYLHYDPIMTLSGHLCGAKTMDDFPAGEDPLTDIEKRELADFMIAKWEQWAVREDTDE